MLMADARDIVDQIRSLLLTLDAELERDREAVMGQNFDALAMPEIVTSVVDHLQPTLLPLEAAVYWFLFRRSFLGTGQQFARVSVRGMQEGVITSSSGQSASLCYSSVQGALKGLEDKGVIAKAGDTTRDGTLYKVCLPDEIPACQERMKQAVTELGGVDEKRELDFYNVRENRERVFTRDGYQCWKCSKQLTRFTATLDHLQPVSQGGDNSYDNLRTACLHCNSRRGNRPLADVDPLPDRKS